MINPWGVGPKGTKVKLPLPRLKKMDGTVVFRRKNAIIGAAEDWTPDFSHAKRALYLWVTAPKRKEIN